MTDCVWTLVEGLFDESLDATYTTYDVAYANPVMVAEFVPAAANGTVPVATAVAPLPGLPALTCATVGAAPIPAACTTQYAFPVSVIVTLNATDVPDGTTLSAESCGGVTSPVLTTTSDRAV